MVLCRDARHRPAQRCILSPKIAWTEIERYGAAIAREFHPEKIILFGSYAYGRPASHSDVDVMVILPHRKGTRPSLEIRRRISAGFPVDILVRAPAEIARRLRQGDSFISEIMSKGRVLYEAGQSYCPEASRATCITRLQVCTA